MNIKERLIRGALVGSVTVSGCLPGEGGYCPDFTRTIEEGTPIIEPPPPHEVIITQEYKEALYQAWQTHFLEAKTPLSFEAARSQAGEFVKGQLLGLCGENLSIWEDRVDGIVGKVQFLQPYEFAVRSLYKENQRISELLDLYRTDKEQAIVELLVEQYLGYEGLWLQSFVSTVLADGTYSDETDEILINLGALNKGLSDGDIVNTVIHEAWHALPGTRTQKDELGNWYKLRGLALEAWNEDLGVWIAEVPAPRFRLTGLQIDHALVYLMDPNYEFESGTTPHEAFLFVNRAFNVFGRERVIQLYLESRAEDFYGLVFYENCSDFSEFLSEGASCP